MVLHGSLVEADIPHHDKMREAVITQWQTLFEALKLELSVGFQSSYIPACTDLNQ
jgi:hypothetical protein